MKLDLIRLRVVYTVRWCCKDLGTYFLTNNEVNFKKKIRDSLNNGVYKRLLATSVHV